MYNLCGIDGITTGKFIETDADKLLFSTVPLENCTRQKALDLAAYHGAECWGAMTPHVGVLACVHDCTLVRVPRALVAWAFWTRSLTVSRRGAPPFLSRSCSCVTFDRSTHARVARSLANSNLSSVITSSASRTEEMAAGSSSAGRATSRRRVTRRAGSAGPSPP